MIVVAGCNSSTGSTSGSEEKSTSEEGAITKNEEEILIGPISESALREAPHAEWYNKTYNTYPPNPTMMEFLKEHISDVEIRVFMGTWCEDSHLYVPMLFRILKEAEYPSERVKMVAVDRDKVEPKSELEGYNIEFVPTIIFYRNSEEIGRIVEQPRNEGLEEDVIEIVTAYLEEEE